MGFNTVAVLYTDCVGNFEEAGHLGARIALAMQAWPPFRLQDEYCLLFGAGRVISQAHADYWQVVIIGHNTGYCANEAEGLNWTALDQMQRCLERHGYKITKPRKKKPAPAGANAIRESEPARRKEERVLAGLHVIYRSGQS